MTGRPHRATRPPARKRFGQHFLEPSWVAKLITLIEPRADDVFLEIGPGHGALTRPLAARSRSVVAFEIDRDLVRALRATVPANVEIVDGDFLAANPATRIPTPDTARLRVAANLPYNVASPILFRLIRLFDEGIPFHDATLMLQREVADRLVAEPGTRDYGVLTILVKHSADVHRVLNLPPGAFRPPPTVQSSVVRLTFHAPAPPVRDRAAFTRLVRAVFTRRRKTIQNALRAFDRPGAASLPSWIDPQRRPETLSLDEFVRLANDFAT